LLGTGIASGCGYRRCLRDPIPEIFTAAKYLDDAVSAHLAGKHALADELIRLADLTEIYEWCETLWGKAGPFSRPLSVNHPPEIPKGQRVKRGITVNTERELINRDGYVCRFCGIPLVRAATRQRIREVYPEALRWGGSNPSRHAAFQAMEMHFDHVLPRSRGGSREPEKMVVTCAPCNNGRCNLTIEEVGLSDPRLRQPVRSTWDGLERFQPRLQQNDERR
jgi:5-methylcytosine-specific restriction endonuclease McrA